MRNGQPFPLKVKGGISACHKQRRYAFALQLTCIPPGLTACLFRS
uniref:Uncharacterized protein n=1 Tax=Anguilla anguilla TaxID=7936 RepID=A0A0E9PJU0_ANGAN